MRVGRVHKPGAIFHLISRFAKRRFCLDDELARSEYRRRAADSLAQTDCIAIAYALMGNHVHWAVVAGQRPLDRFIRPLHVGFAQWFNRRQNEIGPVFADRFSSITFEDAAAFRLVEYIHNNPVRAHVVARASETDWTSHRAYLGLDPAPDWLDCRLGLSLCGHKRETFDAAVDAAAKNSKKRVWSKADLKASRAGVRRAIGRVAEIAGPAVDAAGQTSVDIRVLTTATVRLPAGVEDILEATAEETGLSRGDLCSTSHVKEIVHGRRLALLAWRQCGGRQIDLASTLGISNSAATFLVRSKHDDAMRQAAERVLANCDKLHD